MKVSDIGEFGLIQRLAEKLGVPAADDLIVGIGDDAAVWRAGDRAIIATTDTMVEGVHFVLESTSWCDLGWKALAVNVSDIAAMGGRPAFALVTLALPADTDVAALDRLYEGLRECAEAYGVTVAGGDVVRAPQVVITVALTGEPAMEGGQPLLLRRNAAQAGDVVAVTGTLGDSAGGLKRLKAAAAADDRLVRAHVRPRPRVDAGRAAIGAGICCGIDVSDGLVQDVGHICEESQVTAVLRADAIPLGDELRAAYPDDALKLAATGGEDYELVLAGDARRLEALRGSTDVPLTVVGEIVPRGDRLVSLLDGSGEPIDLGEAGWDHLRS